MSNKRSLRVEYQGQAEGHELGYNEDNDNGYPTQAYHHAGRKLRHRNVPYSYEVTDDMILETLDFKVKLGTLRSFTGKGEEVEFENVKYAGSYQWTGMPLMRDQLGVDQIVYRLSGERSFATPAIPDVLGDPTLVGRLDSDWKSDFVDYIINAKDASFLRPTFSPFEPLFQSLLPNATASSLEPRPESVLDSVDLIADHMTLLHIIQFLQDPSSQYIRTDRQYTHSKGPVVMHHWIAKLLYGAGEPHRGHVNSYTRRVTERPAGERWKGETTQVVRYEVGGMRMMIRYPASARLAGEGDSELKESMKVHHGLETKNKIKTISKSRPPRADQIRTGESIDRSQFIMIKVVAQHPDLPYIRPSDLDNLYLRLVLTQTDRCLIAPHYRGDFSQHEFKPRMISINDPILDEARLNMDPLIKKAMGIWRNMVTLTRKYGKNISFVGNENGNMEVFPMKRGPYEHVGPDEETLGVLEGARSSVMPEETVRGYDEIDRRMRTGDWARLCHDLSSRWEV